MLLNGAEKSERKAQTAGNGPPSYKREGNKLVLVNAPAAVAAAGPSAQAKARVGSSSWQRADVSGPSNASQLAKKRPREGSEDSSAPIKREHTQAAVGVQPPKSAAQPPYHHAASAAAIIPPHSSGAQLRQRQAAPPPPRFEQATCTPEHIRPPPSLMTLRSSKPLTPFLTQPAALSSTLFSTSASKPLTAARRTSGASTATPGASLPRALAGQTPPLLAPKTEAHPNCSKPALPVARKPEYVRKGNQLRRKTPAKAVTTVALPSSRSLSRSSGSSGTSKLQQRKCKKRTLVWLNPAAAAATSRPPVVKASRSPAAVVVRCLLPRTRAAAAAAPAATSMRSPRSTAKPRAAAAQRRGGAHGNKLVRVAGQLYKVTRGGLSKVSSAAGNGAAAAIGASLHRTPLRQASARPKTPAKSLNRSRAHMRVAETAVQRSLRQARARNMAARATRKRGLCMHFCRSGRCGSRCSCLSYVISLRACFLGER